MSLSSFSAIAKCWVFFTDLRKSVHPVGRRRKWVCCNSSARKENSNNNKGYRSGINHFSPPYLDFICGAQDSGIDKIIF